METKEIFALAIKLAMWFTLPFVILNVLLGSIFIYHIYNVYKVAPTHEITANLDGDFGDNANKIEVGK